eukprot:1825818-Pyramimonas_sp.AAC.1
MLGLFCSGGNPNDPGRLANLSSTTERRVRLLSERIFEVQGEHIEGGTPGLNPLLFCYSWLLDDLLKLLRCCGCSVPLLGLLGGAVGALGGDLLGLGQPGDEVVLPYHELRDDGPVGRERVVIQDLDAADR